MKAYILKFSFQHIQPEVWRRVIIPAGATFNRLHETIQYVTNFQSELEPYHSFGIEIEDIFITNNEDFLKEYKTQLFKGLKVKQPARIKIDQYIEKHGEFLYNYDFGDGWYIQIVLEDIVDDYYFGYPTLIAGEGIAPPEDVGGPRGYEEFLKIYHNPFHPEYLSTYAWAESMHYFLLDIDNANELLKHVKFKKTEWEHIDHENYYVLLDKYRGSDFVDVEALHNKDLIIQYAVACTNLYGVIEYPMFLKIYNSQNKSSLSSKELRALITTSEYKKQLEKQFVFVQQQAFVHEAIEYLGGYKAFLRGVSGKPCYVPAKEELLRYTDELYYEKTIHQEKLKKMLAKDFFGGSTLMAQEEIDELVDELQSTDADFNGIVKRFLVRYEFNDVKQANEYLQVIMKIANTTRIWENRGHTPEELSRRPKPVVDASPSIPLQVINGGKVGRNEPCPCGSGKKYKNCCGK